ncbi:glycosyltransferase [Falsibacillus pallidus]|uniref:Glycosyltransferase EpsF n=1 Tax=Falsibacillus pallidus TaxID=493781 RepID=A0A370GR48_9BACI|nr:glycosyltransferase [Falsibacillus pallidus]RDI45716.1 glycosyltransferase EpsF [Falsibacillus pallidus]
MNQNKPIKILHVVGAMNRAGTETLLMNIYRNMNREKVQFDFISYSKNDAHYDREIKDLGGRIIKLSKTNSILELYNIMKKYGPYDAVHSHTLFHCGLANLAAFFSGVKVRISHAHTTKDDDSNFARKLYIHSMRTLIKIFSTHFLACSQEAGKYLFGGKLLERERFKFFPNSIEYSSFLKKPIHEVEKIKKEMQLEKNIVIGHIGRFSESKNHYFLLTIMKIIKKKKLPIKMVLVGDGNLKAELEEMVAKEGMTEDIKFAGIREDIPALLHTMDLFVFPSKYEGLGIVLLEAQASGLHCIVSEAIQPEADMKLGLMTRLHLSDGENVWADTIIAKAIKKQRENDTKKINQAFEEQGFSIFNGIEELMNIYQDIPGGRNEKYINSFL